MPRRVMYSCVPQTSGTTRGRSSRAASSVARSAASPPPPPSATPSPPSSPPPLRGPALLEGRGAAHRRLPRLSRAAPLEIETFDLHRPRLRRAAPLEIETMEIELPSPSATTERSSAVGRGPGTLSRPCPLLLSFRGRRSCMCVPGLRSASHASRPAPAMSPRSMWYDLLPGAVTAGPLGRGAGPAGTPGPARMAGRVRHACHAVQRILSGSGACAVTVRDAGPREARDPCHVTVRADMVTVPADMSRHMRVVRPGPSASPL
jgi:hypothetical protein